MKGISLGTVAIVGVVVFAGASIAIPGFGSSIASIITNQVNYCTATPLDWKCICPEGLEKRTSDWGEMVAFMYTCVPQTQPSTCQYPITYTSVTDEAWKSKVLGCAKDILSDCTDCDTLDCLGTAWVDYSMMEEPRGVPAYAYLECRDQTDPMAGGIWWSVIFSFEDGSLHPVLRTYCKSSSGAFCQLGGIVY